MKKRLYVVFGKPIEEVPREIWGLPSLYEGLDYDKPQVECLRVNLTQGEANMEIPYEDRFRPDVAAALREMEQTSGINPHKLCELYGGYFLS